MYKESEISLEFYRMYFKLIELYKQKNAESVKLDELNSILKYFNNKFMDFNEDEIILLNNVLIISKSIVNNVKNNFQKTKEKLKITIKYLNELENKKKEPRKIK